MSEAPASLQAGQFVGHYEILRPLGRGGMGEVFLGHDTRLDRQVAIKVLRLEFGSDSGRRRRFEVEAKALAALSHPSIVSVFSIEQYGDMHLLVMEFVEGRTLRELIGESGISMTEFYNIALNLTEAMDAAHERGVTHRDLKPENIMVTSSGRVKVLDFGLAKVQSDAIRLQDSETRLYEPNLTTAGVLLGTAAYMSPEQAEGRSIDHRSDLFSLGSVMYEMATGTQAFRGRSVAQLLSSILRDEPEPIEKSRTDVTPGLQALITRCLRKDPQERISSAAEVHQSLDTLKRLSKSLPVVPARAVAEPAQPVSPATWRDSPWVWTSVLAVLWIINWVETGAEELWSVRRGQWVGYDIAAAFTWLEGSLSFDGHDAAGATAVYLGSVAYFFLPVVLLALTLVTLARQRSRQGYKLFILSIAICYFVSLPFYLLLPIPERWAFPDSHAILLSDLWSTRLIEIIRPISGLDNCFPSFHVSGTLALVLVWYRLGLRFRHTIACLGLAVVLSTVLLGIHWLADVAAGTGLAFASVWLATKFAAKL